jgi:hypothetical protein
MKKFLVTYHRSHRMVIEAADEKAAKLLMCVATENVKKTTIVDINELTAVAFEPEQEGV